MASTDQDVDEVAWFLKTSYPVLLPANDALTQSRGEFGAFIRRDLSRRHEYANDKALAAGVFPELGRPATDATSETFTEITPSTTAEISKELVDMNIDEASKFSYASKVRENLPTGNPFMDGLLSHHGKDPEKVPGVDMQNKTFTANRDIAFRSTTNPLVDLFAELEDLVSSPRLNELLGQAWSEDPLMTLKIIFNARSIHLGKSSRLTFYRCAGWLAQHHPLTLVANLPWLSRPVIEKKVKKEEDAEGDIVLVDKHMDENDPLRFDVKHGVSHGYWKDMLNILALAANKKLDVLSDPKHVLNTENPGIYKGKSMSRAKNRGQATGRVGRPNRRRRGTGRVGGTGVPDHVEVALGKRKRPPPAFVGRRVKTRPPFPVLNLPPRSGVPRCLPPSTNIANKPKEAAEPKRPQVQPKELRRQTREGRHEAVTQLLNENPLYRTLHLSIARLFAEQLESDLAALNGPDAKAKRNISLCAKWAPTHDHFHDKHTFIISSIAEIMYPRDAFDNVLSAPDDRETYLRHARERYRKDTSALRKHLDVVERHLTEKNYEAIKYDRVPSIAMQNYSSIFIQNDYDRFEKYLGKVAEGKANISGATLLPSTMVHSVLTRAYSRGSSSQKKSAADIMKEKTQQLESLVVDGQWKTLVQRIKDSGTLSSSIAVCDVSGSMGGPTFADGTTPMDSAIGLSLLVAEVTAAPFGGAFITFSDMPSVEKIDLSKSFTQKVQDLRGAHWGGSTNFVSTFEDLILPMAIENNLKQQDMVKRVFVFSDMQFNLAEGYRHGITERWTTSYERIQKRFEEAGYELPELIFWNLAGGRGGETSKPVTTTDHGTALVSGYSQGMLKVFLDGGGFDEEEEVEAEEEEVVVIKTEDGDVATETVKKRTKTDPLRTVKRAVAHKAYEMLQVLD
jgi:hypothetical protein